MARPRRPVASLQESLAPRLAPQAAPVALGPTVQPPDDLPIYDFAAISGTIAGYLRRQQEERNKVLEQTGEQFAEANRLVMADLQQDLAAAKTPEERDRLQKGAFALLRKQGEIPDMADPHVRIGLERANGRILVGQYWQNLQRRLTDVSLATDPQTGLPVQPLDAERVMAEEWEKIASSPAVQGYYGGQEALAQKVSADAQFLQAVTRRRSEAEKEHYEQTIAKEWGRQFDAILDGNDVVTSETLKPLSAMVAAEVRDHNLLNPRELVLQALELSIRGRTAVDPDPDAAIRAVHAAQDLVIGGVRLGDDRSGVGERLLELSRQVRQDAKEASADELQREETARRLAIQKGQAEYVPALLRAKQEGQSVQQVARALEEKLDASGDPRAPFVVRAMQEFANELSGESVTDPAVVDSINRLAADGQTDAAEALATASLKNRTLSGSDYARSLQLIAQRRDVGQFMEEDPLYNSVRGSIFQALPKGFAPEVQDQLDSRAFDLEAQLADDFAAYARSTEGQQNREALHRTWLKERQAAIRKELETRGADIRKRRDELTASVRERLTRFQDAASIIDQGLAAGDITLTEAEELRKDNLRASAGREELTNLALDEAGNLLNARLQVAFGGPPTDQDQISVQSEAQRNLRDQLGAGIDAMLADPSSDPRTFVQRSRAEARRVVDEIGDKLFEGSRETVQRAVRGGEEQGQVIERVQRLAAEHAVATNLATRLADPRVRETLKASDPVFAPVGEGGGTSLHTPGIPARFYEDAAAWWSGRDPIFGSPVDRPAMDRQVRDLARSLDKSPDRDRIVAGALDVVGVDAIQVLRGEATVEVPPAERSYLQRSIDQLEAGMAVNLFTRPSTQARIDELRRQLEPIKVSLQGHEWKPYLTAFFASPQALDAFSDDPAYPDFLRAIGIDPGDQEAVREWEAVQLKNIARSSR